VTPAKYKAALAKLGMTIVGAAEFFGMSRRQAQRIAAGESPVPELAMKAIEKMATALKAIAAYIRDKKPETLDEAKHMLAVISVISEETIDETKEAA